MMIKRSLSILIGLSIIFILAACSSNNAAKDISKVLGIDLSNGKILQNTDSHGGFHGDGTTYVEISFDENNSKTVIEKLENNKEWNKLPLTDNLNTAVYGNESENTGSYVTNSDGKQLFPVVENGYYFFLDRHDDSNDPKDDTNLLNRHSFNFTIAIYDTDKHILHYCEFDT